MDTEVGKRYGSLIVLEYTGKKYHQTKIYKCQCDCGRIKEVNVNKLHTGHVTTCGDSIHKIKNRIGQRYGRLTVVSYVGRRDKKTFWKCNCDCGNECEVSSSGLTTGANTSCGCKNEENKKNILNLRVGFVDGTSISGIKKNRKINRNNRSGHIGVSYDRNRKKWVAQITFQRQNHNLGRFDTKKEAINARKQAELEYFEKYRKLGDNNNGKI